MQYEIEDLRKSLDIIDHSLLLLVAERFWLSSKAAHYKQEHELPTVDENRQAEQYARFEKIALEVGIDPAFARNFLKLLIDEAYKDYLAIKDATTPPEA